MGKRNKKTRRKVKTTDQTHKEAGKGDARSGKPTKFTSDQLLDKVEEYMDSFEFDLAKQFCQRALETQADSTRALETMGTIHLELGDLEAAKQCFSRCIELEPETGYSKYMYLGQLQTSEEAVTAFLKGIELMKKCLAETKQESADSGASASSETDLTPRDISSAYCAVAEIYLTDECFEDCAEGKCKENIDHALETDDCNAEAYHLLASYQLSKDSTQPAKEAIEKGVSLWLPQMKEAAQTEAAAADLVQVCDVSYPARVNAAKILVEVENYEMASEVLELLLDEEDQVVEVWYLLGWLNYLQGEEDYKGNARFYLGRAKEINQKVGCEDQQIVKHIAELLEELGPGETEDGDEEKDGDASDADDMDVDNTVDDDDDEDDKVAADVNNAQKTDSKSDVMEH